MSELKQQIEAILFAAGKKVSYEDLARLCNTDISAIKNEIAELKKDYEQRDSPLILSEEADGWKMTVREKYLSLVHKMLPETELSKSVLETLAVIAWKHPAMQSDVIKIRTNKAYDHIDELIERGFISKERKGRSYLIRITPKFNEYFELPNNEAIKKLFQDIQKHIKLEETEESGKEKLGELEVFEEEQTEEKKEKIKIYDSESREGEAEETEETEKVTEDENPEESEINEKIKKIQETTEEFSKFEEGPEETEEEPAKEETKDVPAEKEKSAEKKSGRRVLSKELEEMSGDDEEEEQ